MNFFTIIQKFCFILSIFPRGLNSIYIYYKQTCPSLPLNLNNIAKNNPLDSPKNQY